MGQQPGTHRKSRPIHVRLSTTRIFSYHIITARSGTKNTYNTGASFKSYGESEEKQILRQASNSKLTCWASTPNSVGKKLLSNFRVEEKPGERLPVTPREGITLPQWRFKTEQILIQVSNLMICWVFLFFFFFFLTLPNWHYL